MMAQSTKVLSARAVADAWGKPLFDTTVDYITLKAYEQKSAKTDRGLHKNTRERSRALLVIMGPNGVPIGEPTKTYALPHQVPLNAHSTLAEERPYPLCPRPGEL